MRIDVHAHLVPADLPDLAARYGDARWPTLARDPGGTGVIRRGGAPYRPVDDRYWSPDRRLEFLDAHGIDRQVVSPLPVLLPHWAPAQAAADSCRWQNDALARYVAAHPDRFSALGTVPVQHPDAAVAALDQVVELGLAGIEIGTSAGGGELDDDAHGQLLAAAAERGVAVLVHPLEGEGLGRMGNAVVRFGVGVLADTAIAATSLLLGGALRRHPRPRICLAHGGGAFFWSLPRLAGMLERAVGPDEAAAMVAALTGVWVDTASLGPANLRYLAEVLGRDRMVLGTDFPATADVDPLEHLAALGWHEDGDVMASNAQAFLGQPA
ncbi:MAG TPA: amidohydrolase family protein [Acidimicrobiales bacterium]|nr:amidohydrolase family protein [Acidimicrobiales bacterium]